jgi:predicted phosphoribosyltransferase
MWEPPFRDRRDAGRQLARILSRYRECPDLIVLALTRAAIPVAYEVAIKTGAPLVEDLAGRSLVGQTVILVDDGMAAPALPATIEVVRRLGPDRIVAAVAAAPAGTCRKLAAQADEAVCVASSLPAEAYWDLAESPEEELDLLVREASEARLTGGGGSR